MRIVVCDDDVGHCVSAVARRALDATRSDCNADVVLASELSGEERERRETIGLAWPVREEVRRRLATRLAVLEHADRGGVTLFLDACVMAQASLAPLFQLAKDHGVCAIADLPLIQQSIFAVDHDSAAMAALRPALQTAIKGGYDAARDLLLSTKSLPEQWIPKRIGEDSEAAIVSFTHLGERPWDRASASGNGVWLAHFTAALREGDVTEAHIECDILAHALRPSIAFQVQTQNFNPPPEELELLDAQFTPRPLLNDSPIRPLLKNRVFHPPQRGRQEKRFETTVAADKPWLPQQDAAPPKLSEAEAQARALELLHDIKIKKKGGKPPKRKGKGANAAISEQRAPFILRLPFILVRAARNPKAYWQRLWEVLGRR